MPQLSVKKPMTVFVCVVLAIMLGVISFINMTTDLLPSMELPYVVAYTSYIGASPEQVEQGVTKVLESSLATTSGVKNITSISQENVSMLVLEFEQETNMDSAMIEMTGSIDQISGSLPDGTGSPVLMKINPDMLPIMVLAVDRDDADIYDLSALTQDTVIPALERVDGTASVSGSGLLESQLHIVLDQDKIDKLNNRVLASVDSSLADAAKEIADARKEIKDGKAELESQTGTTFDKLASASQQIAQGQAQADEGIKKIQATLTSLQTTQKELETSRDALAGPVADCRLADDLVKTLLTANGNTYDDFIALYAQAAAVSDTNLIAAKQAQMLAMLGGEENTSALQAWLACQAGLRAAGFSTIDEAEAALATINQSLAQVNTGVAQLQAALKQATDAANKLNAAQQQTEEGKLTAMSEIVKATVQLDQAEKALDDAEEQFKEQRDAAYKAAGLDGVITQSTVAQLLTAQNFSMPAGYITSNGQQNTVKVGEKFKDIEELKNWVVFSIDTGNIGDIRLSDIAEVTMSDNANDLYARINGNDGVLLTIQKSSTASTSAACKNLYAAMSKLEEANPGLHLTALSDQGQYIDLVVSSVLENLAFGAVLAVIVLLLFLKDFRPTIIVALSIPISLMLALVLMYFTNITLNIISLSGLALGVGMLVDNSIVAIENIYRLRQLGYNAATAAVHGCRQIAGAITASTLTTVCVFAPILFTHGLTRQLFADMGLTIAYSLGASLLIALTLVPAMSSKMLVNEREIKPNRFLERMIGGYEKLLRKVLRHKAPVLIAAVALLIVSALLAVSMGTAFLPEMDSPQVTVSFTMPEDATTGETREMSNTIVDRILTVEGVRTVGAMEGGGIMSMGSSGGGISIYVLLEDGNRASSQQIASEIEAATADLTCTVSANGSSMDMTSMMSGSGISVAVTGDDLDELQRIGSEVAALLQDVKGVGTVSDGQEDNGAETRISVDKTKASGYGLTVAQVYQQVAAALTTETKATNLTIENGELPVIVVPTGENLTTRETLGSLLITGQKDGEDVEVKLSELASIADTQTLSAINRENQTRTLTVSGTVAEGYNVGLVSRDVTAALAQYELPVGYELTVGGESEMINSTLGDLVTMILLAIALIYLIMVAQFQSLLSPFIVLFTIPLAFTGGLLGLWITGKELSVIAMLGFLVLAGIIVNNGIVFVDYTNQLRLEGVEKTEALVQTGRDRIRPILMTALTTIFGLVTMAMGLGAGGDMLQPLAIVTIGGLTYATLLTLFVVPAIYDILHRRPMKKVEIREVDEQ